MKHKAWTQEELQVLCSLYASYPNKELSELLGHSAGSVFHKAKKLGLGKKTLPWNKGLHGDPRILASLSHASLCRHPETWKGNPNRLGHKPWTLGLTVETSPKLKAMIEKGAAKKRGVKHSPETIRKQAESIRKYYQEHPEAKTHLRTNGMKLAQSPYHHDGHKPGEYTISDATRQQISKTLIRTYKEHPELKRVACEALEKGRLTMGLGKGPTEPERKMGGLLISLGIKAIPQYRHNGFFLDFALPEQKLAILVDGCYWHCCPDHSLMAATKSQQHNLAVDKKRERILKKAGWHLIHIWEHELEDIESVKLRLKKEVMSNAYLADRH